MREGPQAPPRRRAGRRGGIAVAMVGVALGVAVVVAVLTGRFGRAADDRLTSGPQPAVQASAGTSVSGPVTPTELSDPAAPTPATAGATPSTGAPRGTPSDAALPAVSPRSGTGRTAVLPLAGPDTDRGGRPVRYSVELEGGLGIPAEHVAARVHGVLTGPRGWQVRDGVRFVGVGPDQRARGAAVDMRIILASPGYVDRNCLPLQTMGQLSCRSGTRVLLNADRYLQGIPDYRGDVEAYRVYLVNHEVGHVLGHGHAACPGPGRPAPVMMQQSKGLGGCTPYPYPVPR